MVSAVGFAASARAKALALNVTCMELAQAEQFPWVGMHFFIEDNRQFGPMNIAVMCDQTMPEGEFDLFDVHGTLVSEEALVSTIANSVPFPENREDWIDRNVPLKLMVRAQGWTAIGKSGDEHDVSHFEVSTQVTITRAYKPVALHTYIGPTGPIEVVTSEIDIGDFRGKLMMIKGNEETRVVYVPEKT